MPRHHRAGPSASLDKSKLFDCAKVYHKGWIWQLGKMHKRDVGVWMQGGGEAGDAGKGTTAGR